jgi:DNA-directed RNA polymerase specialized sigma24 family protein
MKSGASWKNRPRTVGGTATVARQDALRRLGGPNPRDLILATVQKEAASLLRIARRHSICADDAQDAYQRSLEILIRRADSLPAAVVPWLRTIVKHEAMEVRESRLRLVGPAEANLDGRVATDVPTEDERAVRLDAVQQAAEALARLKPQELRALLLKAEGHSYAEICDITGWTYTKVNRSITEGRRRFLDKCADIEAGRECDRWAPVLSAMSDGEASPQQLMDVRPHLRHCLACRATLREFETLPHSLAALVPISALPATDHVGQSAVAAAARIYDALLGGMHERALLSAHKLQASLEAATNGKLAAVAASAAALTGGGVVAVHDVVDRPLPPPRSEAKATHPKVDSAPQRENAAAAPTVAVTPPVQAPPPSASRAQPRESRVDASARQEFGIERGDRSPMPSDRRSGAPAPVAPAPPSGGSGGGAGEFGP